MNKIKNFLTRHKKTITNILLSIQGTLGLAGAIVLHFIPFPVPYSLGFITPFFYSLEGTLILLFISAIYALININSLEYHLANTPLDQLNEELIEMIRITTTLSEEKQLAKLNNKINRYKAILSPVIAEGEKLEEEQSSPSIEEDKNESAETQDHKGKTEERKIEKPVIKYNAKTEWIQLNKEAN
jgi:hypothetical protein